MAWVRVDDLAPTHAKIIQVGVAFAVYVGGLCYANRYLTDGFIPARQLSAVLPGVRPRQVLLMAVKLVEAGLWEVTDGGYQIHDYHDYQPTAATVRSIRDARAKSGQRGGQRKAEQTASKPLANEWQNPAPPPIPTPKEPKTLTTLSGSTPDGATNGHQNYKAEAREILAWLNEKAGKRFESVSANLDFIEARLREGRPAWLLKKLVSVKARAWAADEKMREFLRPATLFNKTKCAQYIGSLPTGAEGVETKE